MFARHVTMTLKPVVGREFRPILENEILPLLRRQKGFLEELLLVHPLKNEAIAISLWEEKEHAEKFNNDVYPEIVKILNKYVEGIPIVKDFEVPYATIPSFEKSVKYVTA
ncbi:MAG TPA: hypothetical protein VEU52_07355 [Candidatus Limnocylindrales bacterium]|nr:hypothetical protein [Candidatus Limnocylindrales bacterium]